MSELAEYAGSSRSRLSHAVARLEEAGWVRREACPSDRRGAVAVLTDDGFAALAAAAPGHVEAVRCALFDPLSTAQVRQLRRISQDLAEHLGASAAPDRAAADRAAADRAAADRAGPRSAPGPALPSPGSDPAAR